MEKILINGEAGGIETDGPGKTGETALILHGFAFTKGGDSIKVAIE